MTNSQFYIFKNTGIDTSIKNEPKKVTHWQLVYKQTGERVISGAYSLCQHKLNQLDKNKYKIIPL